MWLFSLIWGLACQGGDPGPVVEGPSAFLLARHPEALVALELPESSRPVGEDLPLALAVSGPFRLQSSQDGVNIYAAPIPIRPRNLFFTRAPPGMKLKGSDGRVRQFRNKKQSARAETWAFSADTLVIRRASSEGPPEPGDYVLEYPRATEREAALNRAHAGLEDRDFALRSLELDGDTHTGLFLPAPGVATWELTIPTGSVLTLNGVLLPPEADDGLASDGVNLVVEVQSPEGVVVLERVSFSAGEWKPVRVDLSGHAGESVRLTLRSEPGESALLDYLFLAEPSVVVSQENPRRIVLVFVDTLRPDHMGLYGYERDTTPRLGAWAEQATVFTEARSVAPWTLPSARTLLTGMQPESWGHVDTLQERLAEAGWASGAFVGNIYLSSNFDMADGWSHHGVINWPQGAVQVRRARRFLEENADRDAVVMLHLMDPHLPYTEPRRYRRLWAGEAPAGLSSGALRGSIKRRHGEDPDAVSEWVQARYDQNIRYLDDQLGDFLSDLGDDDCVLLFSDHGEEFWEHRGFEHGHTLFDELLRVPLVVKAQGMTPGRVDAPVSLLDVAPTVLDWAGLDSEGLGGQSLFGAGSGDAAELALLEGRSHAVGRPLYGSERWGVILGAEKWMSHGGREWVYDLEADPGETEKLQLVEEYPRLREAFSTALATPAPVAWRLETNSANRMPEHEVIVEFRHPSGFRRAWLGGDPTKQADMRLEFQPDVVRIIYGTSKKGGREVYLWPEGDPEDFGELSLRVIDGDTVTEATARAGLVGETRADGRRHVLLRHRAALRGFNVTFAIAPVPPDSGTEIQGFDPEMAEELRALGYVE